MPISSDLGARRTIISRDRRKPRKATVARASKNGERWANLSPNINDVMCSRACPRRWICPSDRLAALQHHLLGMHLQCTVSPPRGICPLERPATCLQDDSRIQYMQAQSRLGVAVCSWHPQWCPLPPRTQIQSLTSGGWIPSGLKQCVGSLPRSPVGSMFVAPSGLKQ